jgi:ubiquinone biosynthesis protein UbiJ
MINPLLLILNKALLANESSRHLLAKHHNKNFQIIFPAFSISAIISDSGLLDAYEQNEYTSVIVIPLSAVNYFINHDKLELIKQISISGDKNFGLYILEVLSNINWHIIDNDKILSSGFIINTISKFFIELKKQIELVGSNAITSVNEYLLYESEDLVTRYEMDDFCQAVDELNSRTDLLNARINSLLESSL